MNKQKIKTYLSLLLSCLFIANIFIGSFFVNIFNSYNFDKSNSVRVSIWSKSVDNFAKNTFDFTTSTSKNLKITLNWIKIKESELDFRLNYNQLVSYSVESTNSNIITKYTEKPFKLSNLLTNLIKQDNYTSIHKNTEFFTCNNSSIFIYRLDKKFEQQSFFSSRAPPLFFI